MRVSLPAVATGLFLALGAVGVANAANLANPNAPSWSPYTIGAYDGAPASATAGPAQRLGYGAQGCL